MVLYGGKNKITSGAVMFLRLCGMWQTHVFIVWVRLVAGVVGRRRPSGLTGGWRLPADHSAWEEGQAETKATLKEEKQTLWLIVGSWQGQEKQTPWTVELRLKLNNSFSLLWSTMQRSLPKISAPFLTQQIITHHLISPFIHQFCKFYRCIEMLCLWFAKEMCDFQQTHLRSVQRKPQSF